MENQKKNLTRKERIEEVATRLFYEQGYKNTLFGHIAKELDVTKGLITYHFGTKANLAQQVNTNYITDIHNQIALKLYLNYPDYVKDDPKLVMSLSNLCSLNLYNIDSDARRFYVEYMSDNFQCSVEETFLPLFLEQRRMYNRDDVLNTEHIRMMAFSERAARASVLLGFFREKLNVSFEEVIDYVLSVHYRIERISEKRTEEVIKQAKEIYEELDIQIEPYFKIIIK